MSNLVQLEANERTLAENLKRLCTPYGDERESKLDRSSEILFSMGRLYLIKSKFTDGIEQKLNFIKCAALLHGARVRFEKFLGKPKRSDAVLNVVTRMESSLAVACKGTECDLFELSKNVRRRFKIFRETENTELPKLKIIQDSISEKKAKEKQIEKIEFVHYLLRKNTENFKSMMNYIAGKCLKILGNPPCHFAIAGLGSLAREEITLYSDFEHIILLQEGVQDLPNYCDIQEYFRRFAVVFQVIIIGLGETMIPNIGVKSINNFYSDDKSQNWFYDAYTPSGVSIDGMMPHACKTPLGRQEPTQLKHHKLELIQPVSKMSSYLTVEECLKNGYHLQEVLRQTCFIFGKQSLFKNFVQQANCVLRFQSHQTILDQVEKMTKENFNEMVSGRLNIGLAFFELDTKKLFYRPLSTLLGFNARLRHITTNMTNFEFIQEYVDNGKHKVMWAFATACEVRIKVYAVGGGSRRKVIRGKISDYIGNLCAANCMSVITTLWRIIRSSHSEMLPVHAAPPGILDDTSSVYLILGLFKEAEKIFLEEIEYMKSFSFTEKEMESVLEPLARLYHHKAESTDDEKIRRDSLTKAKDIILSYDYGPIASADILSRIYDQEGRHTDALKTLEKYFEVSDDAFDAFVLRENQVNIALNSMTPVQALSYFKNNLSSLTGASRLAFSRGVTLCQLNLGHSDARVKLNELVIFALKEGTKILPKLRIFEFLQNIFAHQVNNDLFVDAYVTMKHARVLAESKVQYIGLSESLEIFVSPAAALCYIAAVKRKKTYSKRTKLIEKAINICKLTENEDERNQVYSEAILTFLADLEIENFDIKMFSKIFLEAPTFVRNHHGIRAVLVAKLPSFLSYYETKLLSGPDAKIFSYFEILREVFFKAL